MLTPFTGLTFPCLYFSLPPPSRYTGPLWLGSKFWEGKIHLGGESFLFLLCFKQTRPHFLGTRQFGSTNKFRGYWPRTPPRGCGPNIFYIFCPNKWYCVFHKVTPTCSLSCSGLETSKLLLVFYERGKVAKREMHRLRQVLTFTCYSLIAVLAVVKPNHRQVFRIQNCFSILTRPAPVSSPVFQMIFRCLLL